MLQRCRLALILLALTTVCRVAEAQAALYSLTDIGTLSSGSTSAAYGINNNSQVVGMAGRGVAQGIAPFLWQNGSLADLGSPIIDPALVGHPNYRWAYATNLNNLGQTVGVSQTNDIQGTIATLWQNGQFQPLGTLEPNNAGQSQAYAINDHGQIVGDTWVRIDDIGNVAVHAFLFENGMMYDVNSLPGFVGQSATAGTARGINNLGQFAGALNIIGDETHAFLYDNNTGIHDLGTLGGSFSIANAVNDKSQVVGYSVTTQTDIYNNLLSHAFLWDGTMHDLGSLHDGWSSEAYAVNNNGQVVGFAQTNGDSFRRAFLWDSNNEMRDLNRLIPSGTGWFLQYARGINDLGQIVGDGIFNNQQRAFLLTPNVLLTVASVDSFVGQTIQLRGLLRHRPDGTLVTGKPLGFAIDGNSIGAATTGSDAVARLNYVVPASLGTGTHTINVTFVGDDTFASTGGRGTLTVRYGTLVTVANTVGSAGQTVLLRALLRRRPDAVGIGGETLSFNVNGTVVGTVTTASNGTASLNYTIPNGTTTGKLAITVALATDANYIGSSGAATLTVQPRPVLIGVANTRGKTGQTVLLRALLRRIPDGLTLGGETLTFQINGSAVGTATTTASGTASVNYTIPTGAGAGNETITVTFAGDGTYAGGSGTGTLTVTP